MNATWGAYRSFVLMLLSAAFLLAGGCGLSDYHKKMASEQKRLEKHDKPSSKGSTKTKP